MSLAAVAPLHPPDVAMGAVTAGAEVRVVGRCWDDCASGVYSLDEGGALLGTWYGGGFAGLPGAIDLAKELRVLPSGDVAVLDAERGRLVTFAGELLGL